MTGETRYAAAAAILRWLESEPYAPDRAHPGNGREDQNYATDISSWGVLSLGPEKKGLLKYAERMSLTRKSFRGRAVIEGFDFGGPYRDTTFPDRDAVWLEGTAQMAVAYRLAGEE
ncbi:MAG: hypothetical protein D6679_03970 [Candidatus Hydrogenedentota bacterium]|nr:MAG: hypothetical protein D6679_03970 [Candidatus Hydrogenedentota bacterium]